MSRGGASYTPRTTAFGIATGISDNTILNALNDFDLGLISNSLDSKIKALYPFVGGASSPHSYNFIDTSLYQITWSGGVVHDTNGITGNGTNAYGNTNFNDNLLTDYISFGVYSRTSAQHVGIEIGASSSDGS
jgi:hypothetical protein